ncbi:hypothetical protein CKM354_000299000 [Cercospora kikuchii]|uniref:F-box domain-containing protein n=1 Tax=Cercospora kikuchii TaxID=84275 RepID=A0A9P3CBB3_9PEZI|nr:uncharacterized protein CKM354_000299000 [Cercospora kikuchii]GIZ39611.1 hypothetical protein CKM354_000299000 [Cercospora kikuchii]
MATTYIDRLPEELLLQVFAYLERPAPSQLNARKEPSLDITNSEYRDYKNASCLLQQAALVGNPASDDDGNQALPSLQGTLEVALQWYHCLRDYLEFIQAHALETCVQSFALITEDCGIVYDRYPHRSAANQDYRYRAAAALWQHLLQTIAPIRILIVASPGDLGCVTNCAIDMIGDWAFSDMNYHILELSNEGTSSRRLENVPIDFETLEYAPSEFPGIANASLLRLHPWTEIGLNEGSFLKAYGTYEYFERGPPSLVSSIKQCLATSMHRHARLQHPPKLPALKKFVYTAILPFATHVNFSSLLPLLDELDVKLAPDPDSGILSDSRRVGKAELEDCWQEFFTSYQVISRPFRTHELSSSGALPLKKFICRDYQNPALEEELDETFLWLCMPCWAEMRPGVFERQADVPGYPQAL